MNRDERDEFRLGIDRLMHRKIYPILLHSHFDVKLVPVLDPDQHSILRDLYVVGKSGVGKNMSCDKRIPVFGTYQVRHKLACTVTEGA